MARRARNTDFDDDGPGSSILVRLLLWSGLAAIAVGAAVLAAQTPSGAERLATILRHGSAATAPQRAAAPAPMAAPQPPGAELESRRLAESIRLLAADRERLLARLDALERNLDVTASIPRDHAAAPAPESSPPAGPSFPPNWSLVPGNIPPAAGIPANPAGGAPGFALPGAASAMAAPGLPQASAGGLVASEQAAESVATRTEFAIDLGGDSTFEGLRALWAALKGGHPALFDGLRPVVAVREGARPGALELRLIVGPLSNAGAAARLCATLGGAGLSCQPTVFDGQRFALR